MKYRYLLGTFLLLLLAVACQTPTPVNEAQIPSAKPVVTLIDAPEYLCSAITQIRLELQVDHPDITDTSAKWQLRIANSDTVIQSGLWDLETKDVLIPFPDGNTLPFGDYRIDLLWQDQILASHTFNVSVIEPSITDFNISLIPQYTIRTALPDTTMHFYINFSWEGGCPGAPYWIKVYHDDDVLCRYTDTLASDHGTGSHACFTEDASPFAPGTYTAVFTLMHDVEQEVEFDILPTPTTPTPSPSPTPQAIACEEPFAAAGIRPQDEIYRPLDLFDWYTQSVYVGARCRNLQQGTEWISTWYRDGEFLSSTTYIWTGGNEGILWDSVTGTLPYDPFVYPGTYTHTLNIGTLAPISIEFEVVAYVSSESETTPE